MTDTGALLGASATFAARLDEARERLASAAEALKLATSERDEKRQQERALQSAIEELRSQAANERQRHTDEAKSLDRLLSRKTMLLQKQEEFTACIRKLGHLPKDAFDAHPSLSSKQLLAEIEACHKELSKLGHVNKKALDQFQSFSDERDRLLGVIEADEDLHRQGVVEQADFYRLALFAFLTRPPEPELSAPSSTRSSHSPTVDGAEMPTEGTIGLEGAATTTVWFRAVSAASTQAQRFCSMAPTAPCPGSLMAIGSGRRSSVMSRPRWTSTGRRSLVPCSAP